MLTGYCQDLALRGTKWECNKLASGPVRELPVFEVTDSEPIHEANAEAAEKEVNDVQKALSALSLLSPRIKPQPKRPSAGKPKASGGAVAKVVKQELLGGEGGDLGEDPAGRRF